MFLKMIEVQNKLKETILDDKLRFCFCVKRIKNIFLREISLRSRQSASSSCHYKLHQGFRDRSGSDRRLKVLI